MPRREDELTERYEVAVTRLSAAIYRTDPIGIGVTAKNPHLGEYEPVARKLTHVLIGPRTGQGSCNWSTAHSCSSSASRLPGQWSATFRIAEELSGVIRELRR
jgi:hypothetical protein